jgi:hypothetical protein
MLVGETIANEWKTAIDFAVNVTGIPAAVIGALGHIGIIIIPGPVQTFFVVYSLSTAVWGAGRYFSWW